MSHLFKQKTAGEISSNLRCRGEGGVGRELERDGAGIKRDDTRRTLTVLFVTFNKKTHSVSALELHCALSTQCTTNLERSHALSTQCMLT